MTSDSTDPRGLVVDVDARIAWLLRVNRAGSPLGGAANDFVRRLADDGCPMTTSGLSRRETGTLTISAELLAAVERQLRIPDGHLLGTTRYLRAMLRPVRPAPRESAPDPEVDWQRDLDRLAEAVHQATATAADWILLSDLLVGRRTVVPVPVLQTWVRALVRERMRSTGGAYAARTAALARLLCTPSIARAVAETVRATALEPGAPRVADTVAALGCAQDARTHLRLISDLRHGHGHLQAGAARGLVQALSTSSLSPMVADALQAAVEEVAAAPGSGDLALSVACRVSADLHQAVRRVVRSRVAPVTDAEKQQRMRPYLEAGRQVAHAADPMLERLLWEALDEYRDERRRHAALLIGATPYADVMAQVAADNLRHETDVVFLSYLETGDAEQDLVIGETAVGGETAEASESERWWQINGPAVRDPVRPTR
ncbi:hypothetical protein [Allobranchiibius sp. CTAmp26]|uniref:hypothetical protein n=1 Tax=Allobranchiibius sp. CTAmp26 TaxID=2815214 RepID=UPI001AA18D15|nr:hypothetical protein [Allobranchiibius sp. CTAmp26]